MVSESVYFLVISKFWKRLWSYWAVIGNNIYIQKSIVEQAEKSLYHSKDSTPSHCNHRRKSCKKGYLNLYIKRIAHFNRKTEAQLQNQESWAMISNPHELLMFSVCSFYYLLNIYYINKFINPIGYSPLDFFKFFIRKDHRISTTKWTIKNCVWFGFKDPFIFLFD